MKSYFLIWSMVIMLVACFLLVLFSLSSVVLLGNTGITLAEICRLQAKENSELQHELKMTTMIAHSTRSDDTKWAAYYDPIDHGKIGSIYIIDVNNRKLEKVLNNCDGHAMTFSPDGSLLFAGHHVYEWSSENVRTLQFDGVPKKSVWVGDYLYVHYIRTSDSKFYWKRWKIKTEPPSSPPRGGGGFPDNPFFAIIIL